MVYKKDRLEKMKIEKIGEKEEGFLEKLGECYSISTKNGTLSSWSFCPVYLYFIPYFRLENPSQRWTIACPMVYSFIGGSAWGGAQSKYLKVGVGILWSLLKKEGFLPTSIGIEGGWACMHTSDHYLSETKERLSAGTYSCFYGGLTVGISGWLSFAKIKEKVAEEKISAEVRKVEERKEPIVPKLPKKDAWQFYVIADLGAYSKFKLKSLDRDIPINKDAFPLKASTSLTGYITLKKAHISLSFGIFGISTEASGVFRSTHLDTESIDFKDFRLLVEHKLWTNKQILITLRIGCIYTWWSQYRIPESGKLQKKDGKEEVGLLGGINLRLQRVTPESKVIPFIEGTYEYSTPFDGVNRALFRVGITWINFVAGRVGKEQKEDRCARLDIGIFKGYVWGPFIEARDHGVDFKIWFRPNRWNYKW